MEGTGPSHVSRPRTEWTPPDGATATQTLWVVQRAGAPTIRAVVVAYPYGIELDLICDDRLRRRLRFLRERQPFKHAERIRAGLERRGYADRRRVPRIQTWRA